jgi:hypothetical protein
VSITAIAIITIIIIIKHKLVQLQPQDFRL